MHSHRANGILWAIVALVAMSIGGAASAQGKTRARITSNTVYADPGKNDNESNDITVGFDTGTSELIITDSLAGVKAQAPCTKESSKTARCPAAGIYYTYVYGFLKDDKITLKSGGTNAFPAYINTILAGGKGDDIVKGGASPDLVNGGLNDDILFGGAGVDRFYGVRGRDVLHADDGVADQVIDCGKDDDPAPFVDDGLDPEPQNC
jgi:Ca2+-binding RTX toxin-like protein